MINATHALFGIAVSAKNASPSNNTLYTIITIGIIVNIYCSILL